MARCIALDIDCAEMCRLAGAYMSRASECARDICALCAEECRRMAGEHAREARPGERRAAH